MRTLHEIACGDGALGMHEPAAPLHFPGFPEGYLGDVPPEEGPPPPPATPALGDGSGIPQYEPNRVNILQLTIIHNVDRGTLALTCTTPYIEATEPAHAFATQRLYQYLAAEFERVTAPAGDGAMPIYGEFLDPKPEPTPHVARPVDIASRPLVDGYGNPLDSIN
jgi:hypothetical protein